MKRPIFRTKQRFYFVCVNTNSAFDASNCKALVSALLSFRAWMLMEIILSKNTKNIDDLVWSLSQHINILNIQKSAGLFWELDGWSLSIKRRDFNKLFLSTFKRACEYYWRKISERLRKCQQICNSQFCILCVVVTKDSSSARLVALF